MPDVQQNASAQPKDRWSNLFWILILYAICVGQMASAPIFIQPIQDEFGMSDTVATLVFSTFYGALFIGASIPFGILADRKSRRWLILVTSALFSIMYTLQAFVTDPVMLAIVRAGLGVGHAGFFAPAISFLSDKFAPTRRVAIMALVGLASSIGAWAAFSGGGFLLETQGWRGTTIIIGAISFGFSILTYVLTSEPVRGGLDPVAQEPRAATGFREAMQFSWRCRTAFHTILGTFLVQLWGFGIAWWLPVLLHRSYGIGTGAAAGAIGPIHGVVGILAGLGSSIFFSRVRVTDFRFPLWFLVVVGTLCTLPTMGIILAGSAATTILLAWLFMPMLYVYNGPSHATVIAVTQPHMRGRVLAIKFCLTCLASTVIAPQIVGVLSDAIAPYLADPKESLRWALLPFTFVGFWGAFHFGIAARYVRRDIENALKPTFEE